VLILVTSTAFSFVVANNARKTLLMKQKEYAMLLGENLNSHIYKRFVKPTRLAFGRVELIKPFQYRGLDQVIQTTIHGLQVDYLRIFDHSGTVSYSSRLEEVGMKDLADRTVTRAFEKGEHSFSILSRMSLLRAMFSFDMEPETFILRTTFVLKTMEDRLDEDEQEIIGVMEFAQDITNDYKAAVNFLWLVVGASLASSLTLFVLLVTIIRRAERALNERLLEKERLERDLHQSEKLASMGRMVASIAHEIRNPLGIISSSAELLLRRTGDADPLTGRILQAIFDEAKRLGQTVNDFLDYARPRRPGRDPVDIAAVLRQATGFMEGEFARSQVALHADLQEGLLVAGDKDLLYRAFYNLMANSLQAMQGGTVQDATLTLCTRMTRDGQVEVRIADNGPGFPRQGREKLLDPFYTTRDEGTGLGLAIVNNIITSHEGSMELTDAPEGGAEVRVTLPAA
jgi:signal transduction histidine kinase